MHAPNIEFAGDLAENVILSPLCIRSMLEINWPYLSRS